MLTFFHCGHLTGATAGGGVQDMSEASKTGTGANLYDCAIAMGFRPHIISNAATEFWYLLPWPDAGSNWREGKATIDVFGV